jgi:heme-degrading monooxygenase HmoA
MHIGSYAVIFISQLKGDDPNYHSMAIEILALARAQKGFLGFESARSDIGISISYWEDLASIQEWKKQSDHLEAQTRGQQEWYDWYRIQICKIERSYDFSAQE